MHTSAILIMTVCMTIRSSKDWTRSNDNSATLGVRANRNRVNTLRCTTMSQSRITTGIASLSRSRLLIWNQRVSLVRAHACRPSCLSLHSRLDPLTQAMTRMKLETAHLFLTRPKTLAIGKEKARSPRASQLTTFLRCWYLASAVEVARKVTSRLTSRRLGIRSMNFRVRLSKLKLKTISRTLSALRIWSQPTSRDFWREPRWRTYRISWMCALHSSSLSLWS